MYSDNNYCRIVMSEARNKIFKFNQNHKFMKIFAVTYI